MAGLRSLYIPGPTNIPDRIRRAMMVPMEDHRSPDFPKLVLPLFVELKRIFGTSTGEVFLFPASGTGGWEAALTNTLSPGDRVLAIRCGQFSALWVDMAQRLGLEVQILDVDWGEAASAEAIRGILEEDRNHRIQGILLIHNETSTGVVNDIVAVRQALDSSMHPALLYVDGISSVGALDFRMDEWGIDLAIGGSQKAMMLPAGLAFVGASVKALERCASAKCPRVFFDFGDMLRENRRGYFPYTPALPLLYGLRESIQILNEEGLAHVIERHARLAEGVRLAMKACGLRLCARDPKTYSNTVTAICMPHGFDGVKLIRHAHEKYCLSLGAGLAQLSGKVFRIGHLGDLNEIMLLGAIAGVEMALRDIGVPFALGTGVAAAQDFWRSSSSVEITADIPSHSINTPATPPDIPQPRVAK